MLVTEMMKSNIWRI